jgi:hypothetical protein
MSDMRWYYMKVGKGNCDAEKWLNGDNPLKRPALPIFYGRCSIADLRAGKCKRQEEDFYESSLPENRAFRVITVVFGGFVRFLRPAGDLEEYDPGAESRDTWKMMPVDFILPKIRLADVPPVLAGINANAYLSLGTFREMKKNCWGNIKAVECALGHPLPREHMAQDKCTALRLLECMSSVELETLVAKLFEAAGCFVPAHRGGCVKDVDLFAHNESGGTIELGKLELAPGRWTIQVKGRNCLKRRPPEVDYLIGLDAPNLPGCYDGDWLLSQVKRFPKVIDWLKHSLSWLPSEFLAKYEI